MPAAKSSEAGRRISSARLLVGAGEKKGGTFEIATRNVAVNERNGAS